MLLCAGGNDRIGKRKEKYQANIDGKIDIIPLFTLLGVNHRQPILHMSKRMVHFHSIDETINQFSIGYMINPSLHFNKVFL